ncbi:hypothetical protein, partial [Ruthenibacterium lactatiformans]|uniref:hypothetical protein n=1 Tax=Ruthenibacterium lactatiformans TaxID=1550024 RepID=UPI003AB96047
CLPPRAAAPGRAVKRTETQTPGCRPAAGLLLIRDCEKVRFSLFPVDSQQKQWKILKNPLL